MTVLASKGQLRGSMMRWALLLVPGVLLLGILSKQLAGSAADNAWFAALVKPPLYPPAEVFAPVWTALYVLIGFALAMVAAARGARWRTAALGVFAVQFALNLAWSPVFFGAHHILGGLIVLIALDLAVVATIAVFRLVRPRAALLLLPYLAWILFATLLNLQLHNANPDADGQNASGAVTRVRI